MGLNFYIGGGLFIKTTIKNTAHGVFRELHSGLCSRIRQIILNTTNEIKGLSPLVVAVGFEPTSARAKISCLTTWLHNNNRGAVSGFEP